MTRILALLLTALLLWPAHASAQGEGIEAVAEVGSVSAKRPFWIALKIEPGAGASVPWFDPETGGRGIYVSLDGAGELSRGELVLPAPATGEGAAPAYRGPVWLLQEIVPGKDAAAQKDFTISGAAAWSECVASDCREVRKPFVLTLPAGLGEADAEATALFAGLRERAPQLLPWPAVFRADEESFGFEVVMGVDATDVKTAEFLSSRSRLGGFLSKPAALATEDGILVFDTAPPSNFMAPDWLDGLIFLTWADGSTSIYAFASENRGPGQDGVSFSSAGFKGLTFWLALGLAFIGGILLNLMPCVFPVLTLKVFGLVKSAARSRLDFALDGLAYTGGILLSFAIVALALLTFRAGGEQAGWGFQLQSPAFVTALGLVMFLVTLNFAGVFQIRLPLSIEPGRKGEGAAGAFYTGVLATVLATPCTAPFMAPALGFALTLPTVSALGVFLGLGLGLAFPYLVVSLIPKAQRLFPKPGRWMDIFRKVLAVPLAATLLWLMWVLQRQAGWDAVATAALYMALAAGLILLVKKSVPLGKTLRAGLIGVAAAASVAAVALTHDFLHPDFERGSRYPGEVVEFSPEAVWELRLQGKGVFVNFTADWCITCLVNERLVFKNPKFRQFLEANGITYMEADWTRPDADIAKALEGLGRSALPVYAFYPPGGPAKEVVLLPEVLTLESAIAHISARLD